MAISRTQNVSANAATATLAATNANDLILVFAYSISTTIPSLPSGYTSLQATAGTQQAFRLGWKLASAGETNCGTWTNAANVVCLVYRGVDTTTPIGANPAAASGNSASLTYTGLTYAAGSMVAGFGGAKGATAGMGGIMSGGPPTLGVRTNQTTVNGADSGPQGSGGTGTSCTLSVTGSGRWFAVTAEVRTGERTANLSSTLGAATLSSDSDSVATGDLSSTFGALTLSSDASGPVLDRTADLSVTFGSLTASGDADAAIAADLSRTFGALTAAGTVSSIVTATSSVTFGSLQLSSSGSVVATGNASVSLGSLSLSATAQNTVIGSLSRTLGSLSLVSQDSVAVTGNLSQSFGALTLSSQAGTPPATADLSRTFGALTLSASAAGIVSGSTIGTLGTLLLSSTAGSPAIIADLSQTLGALTSTGSGSIIVGGSLATSFGALTGDGIAAIIAQANLSAEFGPVSLSSTGSVAEGPTANADILFDPVTLASSGSVEVLPEIFADLDITFKLLRTILPLGKTDPDPIGGIDIIRSIMPIKPAPLNLTIVTGIIFGPVILRAKDRDNAPIDLTGWKPFAEVRKKPGSSVVIDLAPYLSDAAIGEITIPKWTDEQTYDLKVGSYQWSLILEDPFGDRRGPYMQGAFTITATPTKPPEGI